MIFGSVCSGIEAASCAWLPLGWSCAFVSEIEPFPCAVLNHHYREVPNYGDMTNFKDWPDAAINVLVGGTPCQSFSVAGLRKGLDDPRGNLMLTYLAIAEKYRPEWLVWENVPGVLSSNGGRDFASFLRGLAELGYGFAYRILDAQYFGVAQRRRRVFVVGCLGNWQRAAAVLFERHSLSGHPAPRREAGKEAAGTFTARAKSGGRGQDPNLAAGGYMQPWPAEVAPTLDSHFGDKHGLENQHINAGAHVPSVVLTLAIRGRGDSHDLETRADGVANAILTPNGGRGGIGVGAVAIPIISDADRENSSAPTPSPDADGRVRLRDPGLGIGGGFDVAAIRTANTNANGHGIADGVAHTIDQAQGQAIAFGWQNSSQQGASASASASHTPTLDKSKVPGICAPSLTAYNMDSRSPQSEEQQRIVGAVYKAAMQVRRLTPEECEALQGFRRGYTLVQHRNKPAADGPRYKALGNSMAVPCMAWIGQRIAMVNELSLKAVA